MTQEDIIRMAREAGASMQHGGGFMLGGVVAIKRFAALVRADEREACAMVCEELGMATNGIYESNHECATAIRARGQA